MIVLPEKEISVIIPARNEEGLIGRVIEATLVAAREAYPAALAASYMRDRSAEPLPHLDHTPVEILVVDNNSTDRTRAIVGRYVEQNGVQLLDCSRLRSPCARNMGAQQAQGELLVFVDADTHMPAHTLRRFWQLYDEQGYQAGITGLASLEGGKRAWCWWNFWALVRCLPLAHAKAMPALMFCTRTVFDELGPFDEQVEIGEEWPILAQLYRMRPERLIYDRSLVAHTSSRRMELQRFGYTRTFFRYVWAILHQSGRIHYGDQWRYSSLPAADSFQDRGS